MPSLKLIFLFCTLFALAGCAFQRYRAAPVSPPQTAAALEARTLADPGLRQFLTAKSEHPPVSWPISQWDLPNLTLAAFYYNPALQIARARISQAEAAIVTAGARPNPTVSGDFGGETAPESPWIAGLVGSLPIETAGKRGHRVTAAERAADVARWNLALAAWNVRAQVRTALLEYVVAGQNLNLLRAEERLRGEQVELLEQRLAVGMIPRPEVDTASIQHTQALLAAQAAEGRAAQAEASLAAAIGVPTAGLKGVKFVWPDFDQPPNAASFTPASIQQDAVFNRLDIHRALAEYSASEAALQLEIARQYPDFNLGPDYAFEEGSHLFSVVVGLALPVFNHNQGPIAEARARREQMAAQFLTVQASGIAQSEQALAKYDAALKQFAQAQRLMQQSQTQEQVAQNALQAGAGDRVALNGAKLQTAVTSVAQLNALFGAQQALGDLENAVQRPLEQGDIQPLSPQSPLLKAARR
jgi:outer membrane protein, heavy metal efflux system